MSQIQNILIVDDEADVREAIILTNKNSNRTFHEAADGEAALNLIKDFSYDAIICDITMPKFSGIELLKLTRELGINSPFIFLSGHAEEEILSQINNAGAVKFVEKIAIRSIHQTLTETLNPN